MTITTIVAACVLLALAVAALASGLLLGKEKQALKRNGCRHNLQK